MMLACRMIGHVPSTAKPPKCTIPSTPATAFSNAVMSARSACTNSSSAARLAGRLRSVRRSRYASLSSRRIRVPKSPPAPVINRVFTSVTRLLPHAARLTLRITLQLLGEFLIALTAVGEVRAHGGARPRRRALAHRTQDIPVLCLDALQIGPPLRRRTNADADCLARNDEATEIIEEADELRIASAMRQ